MDDKLGKLISRWKRLSTMLSYLTQNENHMVEPIVPMGSFVLKERSKAIEFNNNNYNSNY